MDMSAIYQLEYKPKKVNFVWGWSNKHCHLHIFANDNLAKEDILTCEFK